MNDLSLVGRMLRAGLISQDQLRIAQKESRRSGQGLQQSLLASGFISAAALQQLRGSAHGVATTSLHQTHPDANVLAMLSAPLARRFNVLPLSYSSTNNTLSIAMENAHDVPAIDTICSSVPGKPQLDISLATRADILEAIDRCYGTELSIETLVQMLDTDAQASNLDKNVEHTQTTVLLVNALLADAVRTGASDVHFEPEPNSLRVRYRIDGVLRRVLAIHRDYWSALLVRIKVLACLNIAETRAAQDGRFAQVLNGRDIDFRVSCFPSIHGENIVIRLLDHSAALLDLSQLDLPEQILQRLQRVIKKPSGLIVMSGPTGSGKSTTLYSALNEIRSELINIVTLEDPVEYSVAQIRQCSINASVKLDFASGIRSILRQDPDVILVGETRDNETAEMVARAALTGHLVLTTVHSQSALGALARLDDLGLELPHLAGHILALVSQRLVRKLCNACKRQADADELAELPKHLTRVPSKVALFKAQGCPVCAGSGYRGRQAIVELYEPSAALHALLASNASLGALLAQTESEQHRGLAEQGIRRVIDGTTSWSELNRVIDTDPLVRSI